MYIMPLPLSLALVALGTARRIHTTGAAERPKILKEVYFARVIGYTVGLTGVLYQCLLQYPQAERKSDNRNICKNT